MARKREEDDPDREARRERRRNAAEKQAGEGGSGGMGSKRPTVGPTGYDYSGWGPNFELGGRPPSRTDFDAMSDEERAAIGLPDEAAWKTAARAWRANFQPGGGNYEFQNEVARAIANSGAGDWDSIANVLAGMGVRNVKEEGQALWRRLKGAFEGSIDPSGRYHRTEDGQWVDVGTSDLARRGKAGARPYEAGANYFAPMQGRSAVLAGLKGGDTIMKFQDWLSRGESSIEGFDPSTGYYYNTSPDGRKTYYDASGYQIDPNTGQTVGHYASGQGYVGGMGLQARAGQAPVSVGTSPATAAASAASAASAAAAADAAAAARAPGVSYARPSPSLYAYPTQDPLNARKQQTMQQPRPQYGGSYGPSGMVAPQSPQAPRWRSAGMGTGSRQPMYGG